MAPSSLVNDGPFSFINFVFEEEPTRLKPVRVMGLHVTHRSTGKEYFISGDISRTNGKMGREVTIHWHLGKYGIIPLKGTAPHTKDISQFMEWPSVKARFCQKPVPNKVIEEICAYFNVVPETRLNLHAKNSPARPSGKAAAHWSSRPHSPRRANCA
jgi:hypothetical protein